MKFPMSGPLTFGVRIILKEQGNSITGFFIQTNELNILHAKSKFKRIVSF